jgi:D-sedoheptulose 7-phosphate isomerase
MKAHIDSLAHVVMAIHDDEALHSGFSQAAAIFAEAIPHRKKILVAGNGGSAGEAQRFALAFVVKFQKEHEAYPALSLASDPSLLTAVGNDFGFAEEFERQVEAFGQEGDIFVALSVSGNSENVIRAAVKAKQLGMKTIALIGKGGGKMKGLCDAEMIIPSEDGSRIQEMHLFILDALCAEMESSFK